VAAGEKNVAVDGASIVQQAIETGLVDEIGIDLVPVLLGAGTAISTTWVRTQSNWS